MSNDLSNASAASVSSTSATVYSAEQLKPLLDALRAAKDGDFSVRLDAPVDRRSSEQLFELYRAFNDVVTLNQNMAGEIERVARTVGSEGRMNERASLPDARGSWGASINSINALISDLARPTTEVSRVITAVAEGDLSQKMALEIEGLPVKGEFLRIGTTVNTMVDQLSSFAGEVTRVAKEVGTEGILGGQAEVRGVSGTWKDLTDNVNGLASNLTNQVRNIALVTTAVANGDLSQKITVDARGEILELKNTVNVMVDQLNSFAAEVTRVAKEVGTEGRLGGQAEVRGVSGTWKDLTDNVNSLASNLTVQLRDVSKVATAIANGDLTQKITVDVKGEILQIKDVINRMVDSLGTFAGEVTRVAKEVGTEGILGGQADVRDVSGTWKDLTDNVNFMARNLTTQVRGIAKVVTAVADGDLSQKLFVEAKGEVAALADTINGMTETLSIFAEQVTTVAREVGTEGKLGGQADVPNAAGTWKDLTDNVNFMANNLTDQVRNIALVTTAVANGDLSKKITVDARGEILEVKNTVNTMVDQLNSFAAEVTRVAREVGTEGKLGGQAEVRGVAGTWKDLTDNVNRLASNLTSQVRNIALVTTAVANGDLSQKITVDVKGEILELKNTINTMVDQLNSFAGEVTRVAKEVGTEGILGGQAEVRGVSGTWKDLTDNVNLMATNLTDQVRNIALVTTAVANGDLSKKITVDARGEILELKNTVNTMVDQLNSFAAEVTRVAGEVGTEGKLGGQANVPNVAGTWKDLTDNVNFMANSLTVQVRAISDVATAVTEGDLTRTIRVEAQGEVDALKNNLNQMIDNLRETTQKNQEQDFLKTNLARFSRMMQGQKSLQSVARLIMSEVTPLVQAHHGVFYINEPEDAVRKEPLLKLLSSYGFQERKNLANRFREGEGLIGQCALEKKSIVLTNVPGDYIQISSGLGQASPLSIIVLPILFEGEIMAVIELASFQLFSEIHRTFLDQLAESIGVVINMIQANMRTEELLEQSQSLTQDLQSQSQELQAQQDLLKRTNIELEAQAKELEEKATLLEVQNQRVEQKNREVELARTQLEEKAEQLAISSKYKSEFLANMSHELRTPLNSMLILAKLLSDNSEGNLSLKQVEFAATIHSSGHDLLNLINDILDLSKVEAGKMEISITDVALGDVSIFIERTFDHMAEQKNLDFDVVINPQTPPTLETDVMRLQQVLKNLLSNAFKFTSEGSVALEISSRPNNEIAFAVRDTGIGIPHDKQRLIFESFQQADGTTSRKFGGTGLGLSISREITRLLGGHIEVESAPGQGSVFTLILPVDFHAAIPVMTDDDLMEEENNEHATQRVLPPFSQERQTLVADDRDEIVDGDHVLLIMEDDPTFAQILLETARGQGFKGIVALQGDRGLALAREYHPSAITLDLKMPVIDGWTVLDQLKRDPQTRHIPVHVISVVNRNRGSIASAIAYLEKPVSREAVEGALQHIKQYISRDVRNLLLVEDDEAQRQGVVELLASMDVQTTAVATGEEGLTQLAFPRDAQPFDCVILDLGLPDMEGLELLRRIKTQEQFRDLPVLIYTSKDLTHREETQLKKYAVAIINKSAGSAERLLEETSMFLHRIMKEPSDAESLMPDAAAPQNEESQQIARGAASATRSSRKKGKAKAKPAPVTSVNRTQIGDSASSLANLKGSGHTILLVDDDMRNIFALTSVLEDNGLTVIFAENGRDGIEKLQQNEEISLVLMDVMMPEMDGYETMSAIRAMSHYADLPIIALTAKALSGDREKCLAAGASEYITKPVEIETLLSLMDLLLDGKNEAEKAE